MVNKLRAICFCFVATVLILFGVFVYLMTTVNPPRDPNRPPEPPEDAPEAPAPPPPESPPSDPPAPNPGGDTSNEETGLKGRRSVIDQRTTNNEGLVIMKVVDDESRPRIEVVLYPRWADSKWKIYRMDSIIDPKYSGANMLPNSIYMSEDTIVVENDEFSPKWGLNSYTTVKNVRRNALTMSLDSQITKVDTILLPEKKNTLPLDDHSSATNTAIKLNEIEQEQTQIKTENINTYNMLTILTNTTFSIATNKVTSPETVTDDIISNVTAVLPAVLTAPNTLEETTQISKNIPSDMNSVETFNDVKIKAMTVTDDIITNVTAVLYENVKTETSETIKENTEIPKDTSSDVDSVENLNDVTIKAVSAEPMTEQITEVTAVSLNTKTETTNETTILETTTE